LLSCVDVASSVARQRRPRSSAARWNARTVLPNRSGSPPTSFSDASRLKRYNAVSSMPFAATGAVNCWARIANATYAGRRSASSGGGSPSSSARTKSKIAASATRPRRFARPIAQSTKRRSCVLAPRSVTYVR
jgi:hypothetical protein